MIEAKKKGTRGAFDRFFSSWWASGLLIYISDMEGMRGWNKGGWSWSGGIGWGELEPALWPQPSPRDCNRTTCSYPVTQHPQSHCTPGLKYTTFFWFQMDSINCPSGSTSNLSLQLIKYKESSLWDRQTLVCQWFTCYESLESLETGWEPLLSTKWIRQQTGSHNSSGGKGHISSHEGFLL